MLMYLGYYDPTFIKNKTTFFNSNSLKNAERYIKDYYKLDKDRDIRRLLSIAPIPIQPSGVVNGKYENIILFRQLKFRNAFTK